MSPTPRAGPASAGRAVLHSDRRPSPFDCEVSRRADVAHIRLTGELDIASTPVLQAAISTERDFELTNTDRHLRFIEP